MNKLAKLQHKFMNSKEEELATVATTSTGGTVKGTVHVIAMADTSLLEMVFQETKPEMSLMIEMIDADEVTITFGMAHLHNDDRKPIQQIEFEKMWACIQVDQAVKKWVKLANRNEEGSGVDNLARTMLFLHGGLGKLSTLDNESQR
jgi:hypothetical protein